MAESIDLSPADIIARANRARETLAEVSNKSRSAFVVHAEVALKNLAEIEAELAEVSEDMDMVASGTSPKGGEKYKDALELLKRELDESVS